jgi:hypothetical protein
VSDEQYQDVASIRRQLAQAVAHAAIWEARASYMNSIARSNNKLAWGDDGYIERTKSEVDGWDYWTVGCEWWLRLNGFSVPE